MSVLDTLVSYFPNRAATKQSTSVNLIRLLTSSKHQFYCQSRLHLGLSSPSECQRSGKAVSWSQSATSSDSF